VDDRHLSDVLACAEHERIWYRVVEEPAS